MDLPYQIKNTRCFKLAIMIHNVICVIDRGGGTTCKNIYINYKKHTYVIMSDIFLITTTASGTRSRYLKNPAMSWSFLQNAFST